MAASVPSNGGMSEDDSNERVPQQHSHSLPLQQTGRETRQPAEEGPEKVSTTSTINDEPASVAEPAPLPSETTTVTENPAPSEAADSDLTPSTTEEVTALQPVPDLDHSLIQSTMEAEIRRQLAEIRIHRDRDADQSPNELGVQSRGKFQDNLQRQMNTAMENMRADINRQCTEGLHRALVNLEIKKEVQIQLVAGVTEQVNSAVAEKVTLELCKKNESVETLISSLERQEKRQDAEIVALRKHIAELREQHTAELMPLHEQIAELRQESSQMREDLKRVSSTQENSIDTCNGFEKWARPLIVRLVRAEQAAPHNQERSAGTQPVGRQAAPVPHPDCPVGMQNPPNTSMGNQVPPNQGMGYQSVPAAGVGSYAGPHQWMGYQNPQHNMGFPNPPVSNMGCQNPPNSNMGYPNPSNNNNVGYQNPPNSGTGFQGHAFNSNNNNPSYWPPNNPNYGSNNNMGQWAPPSSHYGGGPGYQGYR